MAYIMTACGLLSLCFGGFIAVTSTITDIQLGIVVTAVVGGIIMLGLGQLLDRIGRIEGR
jgi:hypothetical protein